MLPVLTGSVVGGGVGGRLSLTALKKSGRYRLVAAADLRPEIRTELEMEYPGLRTFSTHEEMFAQAPTDVVCVSTYPPSHEPVVMAALKNPALKGILVEKPLGDTAAAGRRILQAIQARRLPMIVPHGLRAKAMPLEIVERIARGDIGDLKLIEVQCDKWDLLNAGIHWFDFCLAASGETPISSVLAACDTSTRTYRDGMQVETLAVTYVENARGVRFIVQTGDFVNVNTPGKGTLFRLLGTKGFIEFWGWEDSYFLLNAQHPSPEIITPKEFPVTGHQRRLETLAAQIEGGTPDYCQPESSLAALEICEAAFLSHRHGCLVKFPLSGFVPPAKTNWELGKPYAGAGGGRDGRKLDAVTS
jgi:predicted dehydrogenase